MQDKKLEIDDIYFGIASYKRADKQPTLKFLNEAGIKKDKIIISVQTEEDYKAYQVYKDMATIIFKEAHSAGENRNTILDYFKNGDKVVLMDDDFKYFGFKDGKNIKKATGDEFIKFVLDAYDYSIKNRAKTWGCYYVENGMFMKNKILKRCPVVGHIMGIIVDKYRFDTDFECNEDYEYCLQQISEGHNVIRFDFAICATGYQCEGGCYDMYQTEIPEITRDKLVKKYFRYIKKKGKGFAMIKYE